MASKTGKTAHVAECLGVKVPDTKPITPARIERINSNKYEWQEIMGALEVIKPGDHVLEMGSGIGLVGAIAAKKGKAKKVLSFEANPALIPHIEALYKMNRLSKKIEVRNEVLISAPERPKTIPFHVRTSFLGSSLIESKTRTTKAVDVPTTDYAKIHKDFAPDVLLLDIEGGELDFFRHASLEGVRAIVVEFHPHAYGKDGMRECKTLLANAGFVKVAAHSTRYVWTCVYNPEVTAPAPDSDWASEMTTVENAIVVPPPEQNFVQAAGVLHQDGTYCSTGALWRNGRALTVQPAMPEGDLPLRKGTWLWGGVLWMHFGHFLAESSARLWALDHLKGKIDGVLFIPKRPRNGSEVIEFQKDFANLLHPDLEVACAGEAEIVENLIVPGQGFGLGQMSEGTPAYRDAMTKLFAKDVPAEGNDKLYISRSKLPTGRGNLLGEAELEDNLAAQGYTIYHPEKHDLRHQIATYKAAKKVIAAEGSALHLLAMVADPKADVAIIVRRPSGATRNLERHLEAFMGKPPITISELSRSWKPLGKAKPRLWMGELDMPALQKELAKGKFIKRVKAWKKLDPKSVHKRLGDKFEEVA